MLGTLLPGFAGTSLPDWLADRLRRGLAGVCLFGPNVESWAQLQVLTGAVYAANPHAVVAIDEEGGDVTRLFASVGSPSPGNAVLGRIDDVAWTRREAARIGAQLCRAGVNLDFSPSVDVNTCAYNPVIGTRSFGASADRVAEHGAAWITGLQASGVAATAKHFPGHGDTTQDSHLCLPVVGRTRSELEARELVPFAAAVRAGVRAIMTSHLLLPQLDPVHPATMSQTLLTGLLRQELGFDGLVVSDALDMAGARPVAGLRHAAGPHQTADPHQTGDLGEAAVAALRAGCDLLCLGTDNPDADLIQIEQTVHSGITTGSLDAARVAEAAGRVRALADDLTGWRAAIGVPSAPAHHESGHRRLMLAFDVRPGAGRWRGRMGEAFTVVRIESDPNVAVGGTPWGPFAAVQHDPATPKTEAFAAHLHRLLTPKAAAGGPLLSGPVLVVGRDIGRHGFAREAVDRLRAEQRDMLVVDMGWPSPDRRYADLATFGASRAMGAELLSWLFGAATAGSDGTVVPGRSH